jgi:acetyltransferase-like isoleucine patch superfamily enzyme
MAIRHRLWRLRRDLGLVQATLRDLRPPPPGEFGSFGRNSWIVPPARVTTPASIHIGNDVAVLEHAWLSVVAAVDGVTPRLEIGDGTHIGRFANIACVGEVIFGREVLTADRIFVGDTYHEYQDHSQPIISQPMAPPRAVRIGDGAFLGVGCIVLPGVTVGEGAYVGAGAVVVDDVEPRTVVVGNPARPIRSL